MKYFSVGGLLWHCDCIFNWVAVDSDGLVFLYQNKPFIRKNLYWTSGHTNSYDYRLPIIVDSSSWEESLVEIK